MCMQSHIHTRIYINTHVLCVYIYKHTFIYITIHIINEIYMRHTMEKKLIYIAKTVRELSNSYTVNAKTSVLS